MNNPPTQSALREWWHLMTRPPTLLAQAGIAALLTLMGAFGTDSLMRFAPRAVYWLVMVVLSYSVGFFADALITHLLRGKTSRPLRLVAGGLATGAGVSALVLAMNLLVFGFVPEPAELPPFFAIILAMAMIVSGLLQAFHAHLDRRGGTVSAAREAPALLDRLPLDKRAPLVSITVEDHYVRVQTLKADDLLLLRLSDALREVSPTRGLQVHRSHWVALDQVTAARREGDRAVLSMSRGRDIPVSRSRMAAAREAGLLPR